MTKKLISFVIPAYNESENISLIYGKLRDVFSGVQDKYDYEIIFIDDGSHDESLEILEKLAKDDCNVKYVQFSRNFGKEIALSAGLRNAFGDAVILLDADQQHPPEYIPQFLDKWERGAEVVIGVRENYHQSGVVRAFCSHIFYKLQNSISEVKLHHNETDYSLLDKKVVAEYNKFTERGRISRGLISWLGFRRDYVPFRCGDRKFGKTRFNHLVLIKLAFSALVSQSLFPLKATGYFGAFITLSAGGLGLFMFVSKFLLNDAFGFQFSSTGILAVLIIFLVGIILMCLGLVALYIANIQVEVTNRPIYVIRQSKNVN